METNNNHLPDGTIVWKMGTMWGTLSPDDNGDYISENAIRSEYKPDFVAEVPMGKGSFKRSFQIIGTPPKDAEFCLNHGWVNTRITITNGQLNIHTDSGSAAASKRWAMGIPSKPYRQRYYRPRLYSPDTDSNINVELKDLTTRQRAKRVSNNALYDWLRSEVYIRDRGICWVCNEFATLKDYDLGHLVDRSNGGNASLDNCAVMHKRCNSIKPRHNTLEDATTWRLTYQTS